MKQQLPYTPGPIGVFDSGYGGLTILNKIREILPEYDYIYLGDNARTPYGTRSFEIVYEFTLQVHREYNTKPTYRNISDSRYNQIRVLPAGSS